MPMGRFTKNTHRQPSVSPNAAISRPPSTGPTAEETPSTAPNTANARPRTRPENSSWM